MQGVPESLKVSEPRRGPESFRELQRVAESPREFQRVPKSHEYQNLREYQRISESLRPPKCISVPCLCGTEMIEDLQDSKLLTHRSGALLLDPKCISVPSVCGTEMIEDLQDHFRAST